ncbi:hypothetical protein RB195_004515 [Necator americanus]|uniref:Uncharacterized protein n=1 Tax=Necator americanus TaxID=51031 RepID=A0ABR1BMW2_NECAM
MSSFGNSSECAYTQQEGRKEDGLKKPQSNLATIDYVRSGTDRVTLRDVSNQSHLALEVFLGPIYSLLEFNLKCQQAISEKNGFIRVHRPESEYPS